MNQRLPPDAAERDDAAAAAFAAALERIHTGQPAMLLLAGGANDVRSTLGAVVADAALGRGTRVVEIDATEGTEYDPIAVAVTMWRKGARRVAFDARQRDVAWNWIGLVPLGNLVAAIGETVALVGSRRAGRDADTSILLRAARGRSLVVVMHDLHRASRAGAVRLCAAIESAPPGTRLLFAAGADPAMQDGTTPAIFDAVRRLDSDRVHLLRVAQDHGAVDRLRAVSATAAAAVQAAAVIGTSFDSVRLARLLDIDELDLEDRLAVAVRAGLLRTTGTVDLADGDVATSYVFEPAALRDAVLASTSAAARVAFEQRLD